VDAKDRLRRYLEQRRELGESEFVLDGLSVDEVLKMVGARAGRPAASARAAADDVRPEPREAPRRRDHDSDAPPPMEEYTPTPPAVAPPTPEVRFSAGASTDWRATLRNVAPPPTGGTTPPAAPSGGAGAGVPSAAPTPARAEPARALPAWLSALGLPAGLDAGRLPLTELRPDVAALASIDAVAAHVAGCQGCALHVGAKRPVPGEGNPNAEVLCIGEAPGANEDEQGRPFVGEAGQLLTKILGAIQLTREEVFICNVLKHRPPGNRDPLPDEVAACQPYLLRQIELVRPKVIIAWGRFAAQTLLQTTTGIGQLRGQLHRYHGVPLIVTYHPAALLRNEAWKRPTWEDVKLARRVLDAARAASSDSSALENH
jgi:DNA polymerase